jgi:hypothetical protein
LALLLLLQSATDTLANYDARRRTSQADMADALQDAQQDGLLG